MRFRVISWIVLTSRLQLKPSLIVKILFIFATVSIDISLRLFFGFRAEVDDLLKVAFGSQRVFGIDDSGVLEDWVVDKARDGFI